jgi:hypothetical protein
MVFVRRINAEIDLWFNHLKIKFESYIHVYILRIFATLYYYFRN